MNEIIEKDNIEIENMIYEFRGKEVMLDSDLAKLYHVETKRINEAVKNNPKKFPEGYIFRLNEKEYYNLKSKISTSKGGSRKGHTAFSEQGVYMLATILKSDVATEVTIELMDTFVKMRQYINLLPNKYLLLENKVNDNTKKIEELINKFTGKEKKYNYIFFEHELYDAYSIVMDILKSSEKEIIIIDNYASKELLDMIKDIDRKIIIVSKNIDSLLKKRYESQYNNVTFINNDSFHDRFIILDRYLLFLCGSSFKDLGKKCFGISELKDKIGLKVMLEIIGLK